MGDPDGGIFEDQRAWIWSIFNGGGGRIERGENGWFGYGKMENLSLQSHVKGHQ
ncbi:hypothetical protein [Arcticibacter sp. MXS-1]|uniref:hypothetical protein n=1 Tax=Arcticibacter sp. MXS-1 TaxID=3341726 RepID=UPI0035A92B33